MGRLDGQLVAITGASRGIGAATALAVSEHGGDIVLLSRDRAALDVVAAQVRARGRRGWVIPVDLRSDAEAIEAAFDAWLRAALPELAEAGVLTTIAKPALVDTEMVRVREGDPRPRMSPQHVAEDLVSCMLRPRAEIAPWWVRPAEVATAIAPHTVARLIWAATGRSRTRYSNDG